jgi:hypothetical protein
VHFNIRAMPKHHQKAVRRAAPTLKKHGCADNVKHEQHFGP